MNIVKNQTQTVRQDEVLTTPNTQVRKETVQTADNVDASEYSLYKTNQIVWYVISIICILVGIRFLLLFLGANRVGFADFIYTLSSLFTAPFAGLFPSPVYGDSFFDSAAIVALIAYPILGYIINSLLRVMSKNS